ncbi:MAG: Serine/threonine-protein kinase PknK [Anaerolineae bacterium]|nr:Serine/threonine-protein kinase PknK [Anaerolineae bacterium]
MVERLGRYDILEKIGQGGFAEVYRAYDRQLDRHVALKELRPVLLTDPDSVKRFHQEARNIARLDHPNVVTIFDVYEAGQRRFIVMQLIDGLSLEELIAAQGRRSWPETVETITAVAVGLDYAHTRNILHRDLKPANILLDSNHGPMLSDFGLAKLIGEADTSVTASGGVVGTPHYIAPEVWEGQGTSRQSDIYALGCILYEMLTGEKLFAGQTPPAVMMAHFRALTLPKTWPQGVPPGVTDVLATALAAQPANRYATAGELAQALAALATGSEASPSQPEPARPGAKPVSPPILATKLFKPPPRPEFVPRPHLIERLNLGLHRRLILISAPAGFGKTTLVSSWLNQRAEGGRMKDESAETLHPSSFTLHPSKVAWFSLDEGDNDLARFLTYLVAALQTVAPEIGAGVLNVLRSPQPPPTESILTALLNEIAALPDNFILVLDDTHVIEAKAVNTALAFLAEHLPPQLHLVIATREDPPLPLARYRVRGQLTELRAADLRFTPAEAASFLNQMMGLNLSAEEITALETRTEGWIAGLQLAALALQGAMATPGQNDAASFIKSFTGSHHFVLDYLVEEVLHQQPENVQAFLLRTSILDRMCGSLCDAVLGKDEGGRLKDEGKKNSLLSSFSSHPSSFTLEYLERANLFIVPLDNERRWFRYHHLFADLLRRRLHQHQPETVATFHLRASQWYEDNGLEIEAFRHAAAANDVERAERLVEGGGMPLHFRGAVGPVLAWLESLPTAVLDARPSLWIWYASALSIAGQNSRVEEKLQAAEAALQTAGRGPDAAEALDDKTRNFIGHIAAIRATLAAIQHKVDTIITQSRRALEYLHPNNLPVRTATTWKLGLAYQYQGDRVAASRAYTEAISISEASGNIFVNILSTTGLGIIQESDNRLYLAAKTYRRVLQLIGDPPGPAACEAVLGLARLAYQWNKLDTAQQHGQQSLYLARQLEMVDSVVSSRVFLARLKLVQGDAAGAVALLAEADEVARRYNFGQQLPEIAAVQVLTLLQQGDLAAAAQLAQTYNLPRSRARVHLARGEPEPALAALEPVLQQAEARDWADERLKSMVLQVVALQAQGKTDRAAQRLVEALALAEPGGFIRIFVDEGAPLAELLGRLKGEGGRTKDYVHKLLTAFGNGIDEEKDFHSSSFSPDPLVEPLSDRELEVLQLIAEGLSNHEIGERLFLALSTVKGHNRTIFGKLQVKRRTEALARARELGLL